MCGWVWCVSACVFGCVMYARFAILCVSFFFLTHNTHPLHQWYPEVNHYVPNIPHILVGTKVDLRDSQTADPHTAEYDPIPTKDGEEMARQIKAAKFLEVSAKTRKGLDKVFKVAVNLVLQARGVVGPSQSKESGNDAEDALPPPPKRKKKGCILM